ncbi:hypothetical protein [Paenibacillus etheri]|uniref:hypothetical protein n=1 Tax=Paenibacillus etheri TaxID=1306852 RepID=UPI001ADF45ED|nr:hypothetical protein [Paenibacillus etheri]
MMDAVRSNGLLLEFTVTISGNIKQQVTKFRMTFNRLIQTSEYRSEMLLNY